MDRNRLYLHEWIAIVVLGFMILTFLCISFRTNPSLASIDGKNAHYLEEIPYLTLTIQGAVEKPGEYQVRKGTPLKEALELAKPLPNANLTRLRLDSPVTRKRKIIIRAARQTKRAAAQEENSPNC